jgi:PKD repeat protein
MAVYYVEATGSNTYPFDSRITAATSFYELFLALDTEGIYELSVGDIVYVNGLVTEPNEWGGYPVYGASVIGTDSLIDRINISTGNFYSDAIGCILRNIGIFTDTIDADGNQFVYGPATVEHCRFNGGGIAANAIVQYEKQDITYVGNTFEGFTEDAISLSNTGTYGEFLNLNQSPGGSSSWQGMDSDALGNVYAAASGPQGDIFIQMGGTGNFVSLGAPDTWYMDVAVSPDGNTIYACTDVSFNGFIYKKVGAGAFTPIFSVTDVAWEGVAVAPNGDVYAVSGVVHDPNLNQGIYCDSGAGFVSLNEPDRYWSGIGAAPNGDIYAITSGGAIYKRTGGTGGFLQVASIPAEGRGVAVASNGDVYVVRKGGSVYRQPAGSTTFTSLQNQARLYQGIAITPEGDIYLSVTTTAGSIYKRDANYVGDYNNIIIVGNSIRSVTYQGVAISLSRMPLNVLHFYNNAINTDQVVPSALINLSNCLVLGFIHSNNVMTVDFEYLENELPIAPDATEIVEDPKFAGSGSDPLSIDGTSPCYHSGRQFISGVLVYDILGIEYADPPSIGAYEFSIIPPYINADFIGTPRYGIADLIVNFTDLTEGAVTAWDWDFGDGSPHSTEKNPVHIYTESGYYTVSLTVYAGVFSYNETKVEYIVVYPYINVDFIGTPRQGYRFLTVQFEDISSGFFNSWFWAFGDGEVSYTQNPSHYYDHPGVYTVYLTVSGISGTFTVTKNSYIIVVNVSTYDVAPDPDKKAYLWGTGLAKKMETGVEIKNVFSEVLGTGFAREQGSTLIFD